jgi:acetylglutamate kinase
MIVAKLGGNALAALPEALALGGADGRLAIVHGGGAQISELMRRRGIEPNFVGGRRITDLPILACVRSALARVSDELADAVRASGYEPAQLIRGEALVGRRLEELGLVGRIDRVEREPLDAAWAAGRIPLLAPLARDGDTARYLNVNADDVAAAVAAALGADELVFLSDVPGVLDADGVVIPEIRASLPPRVDGGMLPKLEACATALRAGVLRVRIGAGTVVTA